jgi:hypothetical protein
VPVALGVLDGRLEDEIRHRVVFDGVGFGAQAQRFQGDAAAARERVQHFGRLVAEAFADAAARLLQQVASARVAVMHLPAAQVGDEACVHFRVFGKQRAQHGGARGHQRSPRPPHMQGGDVPVSDGFLAPRLFGQFADRQHRFNQESLAHCPVFLRP